MQRVLKVEHAQVKDLVQLRGQQIAAEKPAWAQSLGEVPANERNAKHWYRVAAEVEAFREKYNIPETEQTPIPKQFVTADSRGEFLAAQVTNVHKRSVLSSEHRDEEKLAIGATTAEVIQASTETPSQAEVLMKEGNTMVETATIENVYAEQDRLWSVVEDHYRDEREVLGRLDDARGALDEAVVARDKAVSSRDRYGDDLVERAAGDYTKVEDAQARAESANFFTRSARTREFEAAQADFEARYGRPDVPTHDDVDWLSTDGEYVRRAGVADEAQQKVDVAQSEVASLESKASVATGARQRAYGDYVAERESHEESRVIKPSMTEAKAHEASEKTAAHDTGLLKIGSSPQEVRKEKAASAKLFAQQQRNATQNKTRKTPTATPKLQDSYVQKSGRRL